MGAVGGSLDDIPGHSGHTLIEAMFTDPHHAAQDWRVLVLTGRQRAFAALGGVRTGATIAPV